MKTQFNLILFFDKKHFLVYLGEGRAHLAGRPWRSRVWRAGGETGGHRKYKSTKGDLRKASVF